MKLLVLSDIHGNMGALASVLADAENKNIDGCVLLGDLIDYGMHSNEVIKLIDSLDIPVICNIFGNHEDAIVHRNYERFSTPRGVVSAKNTAELLTEETYDYLANKLESSGKKELYIDDNCILAVHGCLNDVFWKSVDVDVDAETYSKYDVVFSGHSHKPHFFEKYIPSNDESMRFKKKIIFINPGSVGQPRNHNRYAQYAVYDTITEQIDMCKVYYDIYKEQQAFNDSVDCFYMKRLEKGI